ncbi:Phage tail protein [Vibrio crassostreae]|nr:Phage tail protein [Vibrio crassostreae]CAK2464882.1 Phage tail protein [Vibrio crassostreae]CAK2697072.1 Phage tail protein [Vibrio crassostreae]CAK2829194.1 Phage tail protein [Vibrio crassostreae]CAK2832525.1 Phage tail protein [Vibrio crassostreae]
MMTFQDAQMMEVKQVRVRLMVEADHLVNTALDNGVDETPFRQYRQALRDIPQTYSNPEDVVWPQKPSLPQASA